VGIFGSSTPLSVSPPSEQQHDLLTGTLALSERPRLLSNVSHIEKITTPAEGAMASKYHILIVDDNAINRR
jgi:hypothetical protein